ncbi:MAG TPA: sigma 54-interacting transcriptional regulator [Polyangiaceae bacterium]|nr:sigma 54-interacting transcriptional regulator [Polyangiaceae bacterium]
MAVATQLTIQGQPVRWTERAGQGATSLVWLGEWGGGSCVLKLGKGPAEAHRFADEAERLLFAAAPEFPSLLALGLVGPALGTELGQRVDAGTPYLVLSSAPGVSLADVLSDATLDATRREQLSLVVARDLGAALSALHGSGAAHGDVKPANIIVDGDRARLVDFGLSGAAEQVEASGGTAHYLAPEVFASEAEGDARARDLWALGVTLLEILQPESANQNVRELELRVSGALALVVRALLSRAPGARPSASWVLRRALASAKGNEPLNEESSALRRCASVRRSYLSTRKNEIFSAARSQLSAPLDLQGPALEWVTECRALAQGIHKLRGLSLEDAPVPAIAPLDELSRARFLVALVGPAAASWPALRELGEGQLLTRLLELATRHEPESFTLATIEHGATLALSRAAASASAVDIALSLGSALPDPAWLDSGESRVTLEGGPLSLALALARAFRLRGELGRALAFLSGFSQVEAKVASAELCRRARDSASASALLSSLDPSTLDREQCERVAAIRARIALDSGDSAAAAKLLEPFAHGTYSLEVRALLELSLGQTSAALDAAQRARLQASNDEERARAEGLLGLLAHARGEAESARHAFRAASDLAARTGALLEEATYLTGLAAAATNLGELGEALSASRRALLLFEALGRTGDAARASLSAAVVYASAGAQHDARAAALETVQRAKASGDQRCRGYAHLVLSDSVERADDAIEHASRALSLLVAEDDALCAAARLWARGSLVDVVNFDASARRDGAADDARLEWWAARARHELQASDPARPDVPIAELNALSSARASLSVRGRALHAGAALATRIGDADSARRLGAAAGDAAREFLRRTPSELQSAVRALDWVRALDTGVESNIVPEQIADVEALVRSLSQRDRLRPLLRQVVDALVLWTGVERGLLLLRAPGGKLKPRAARNLRRIDLGHEQLTLSQSLARRALELGEPVVAVDAAGDLPELHASVHALKLRSVLAVPLIARGEALGVVYLDDRVRRGAFGSRELSWVRLVGTLAAVAILDARSQLLLKRSARRAERAERKLAQELAHREAELDVAERELARSRDARETRFSYNSIIGQSEAVRGLLRLVDRVTSAEVPVLILGESGSGKELVARAIHENGSRAKQPFVSENCGAIPEGLLEATLFGHVRGAFTGATRPRAGLFEVADHGTFFLDEIAEMSLNMQTKLLRVLQNGEVHPVGADAPRFVDVRVIGATHRDLEALVVAGKFREDLYYRLNVVSVRVPALRERVGDVPLLVRHFVSRYAQKRKVTISKAAMDALSAYRWPGNIRQLENEVRRALVLADDVVTPDILSPDVIAREGGEAPQVDALNLRGRVDALESELVRSALKRTQGNQTRAAELLGLSRFGLQKMIKRLQIAPD